jgi:2-polyprenyl-3-methyl-5-hydroxy-6-metoxy-1,4-benzoquinol methylase
MPYYLAERDTESTEQMDDPHCSQSKLFNTYRQFSTLNTLLSGWKRIYKSHIKPVIANPLQQYSLLDIGFGGGDIPLKLAHWAAADGLSLNITAIETDERALTYAQHLSAPDNVLFRHASSTGLASAGQQFDIVISNHLLHHLAIDELHRLLRESKRLSRKRIIFNDLERSDAAYGLFNLFSRPFFHRSFITADGLTSIKRSYTRQELASHIPGGWKVEPFFPFRLLLRYEHDCY